MVIRGGEKEEKILTFKSLSFGVSKGWLQRGAQGTENTGGVEKGMKAGKQGKAVPEWRLETGEQGVSDKGSWALTSLGHIWGRNDASSARFGKLRPKGTCTCLSWDEPKKEPSVVWKVESLRQTLWVS